MRLRMLLQSDRDQIAALAKTIEMRLRIAAESTDENRRRFSLMMAEHDSEHAFWIAAHDVRRLGHGMPLHIETSGAGC